MIVAFEKCSSNIYIDMSQLKGRPTIAEFVQHSLGASGGNGSFSKRLRLTESLLWVDNYNIQHTATPSAKLDATYTYNNEGRMASVS